MTAIVGIMRFSVLSTVENPFLLAKTRTIEQLAEELFAPTRLDARLKLFEHITLASLDAQTDGDFTILLVASRLTPLDCRLKLERLAKTRAYLRLLFVDETDFRMKGLRPLIVDELVSSAGAFTTFRMDDDDAVSRDFIARLRRYTTPALNFFGVSLCNGFWLDVGHGSRRVRLKHRVDPNLAVGLAYVSHRKRPRIFYDVTLGHVKMHRKVPVITDGRAPAFLALTHPMNDTGPQRRLTRRHSLSRDDAQKRLDEVGFSVRLRDLLVGPRAARVTEDSAP